MQRGSLRVAGLGGAGLRPRRCLRRRAQASRPLALAGHDARMTTPGKASTASLALVLALALALARLPARSKASPWDPRRPAPTAPPSRPASRPSWGWL